MVRRNHLQDKPLADAAPRVAYYTRISTDEEHQKYSLPAQRERLDAFCHAQYGDDWTLAGIYTDTESGTHMDRPGLKRLLADAETGLIDILLVFRVDRLSRKVHELGSMIDRLTKCGVALRSITEPFDTSTLAGKMMMQMLGVFGEFEHGSIVERTKVGMAKKAQGGRWVGGVIPYGYRLEPKEGLVVQDDEAVVVRRIFNLYVGGRYGSPVITQQLNAAGYRKRSGQLWDRRMVLHMLRNPVYAGQVRWNGVHPGNHPAIITADTFARAQKLRDTRAGELKGRHWHIRSERLLTGRITCGKCGSPMSGISCFHARMKRKVAYYVCNRRWGHKLCDQDYIRADLLEDGILAEMVALLSDGAFLDQVWTATCGRLVAERPALDAEVAGTRTEIATTRQKLNRYFEAFESGGLSPDDCREKIADLRERLHALERRMAGLTDRQAALLVPEIDRAAVTEVIAGLARPVTPEERGRLKPLVQMVVERVVVRDRDNADVVGRVPTEGATAARAHPATAA